MLKVVILTIVPKLIQNDFDGLLPIASPEKQGKTEQFHFCLKPTNYILDNALIHSEIRLITDLANKRFEFFTNFLK